MSYRFSFFDNDSLLFIFFEGVISPEEELRAVREVSSDPRMNPNPRILVDRTRAQMQVTPEDVEPQIQTVQKYLLRFGQPKVAIVVSTDYDFGMSRMLELSSEGQISHQFMVFRDFDDACRWLGADSSAIHEP